MRLIKVNKGAMGGSSFHGAKKSINNIKQMLLDAGYTNEQISALRSKDLVLISPGALCRRLGHRDELYIVDPEEPSEVPDSIDRFSDL